VQDDVAGGVWQELMLLINAPILGLSATVGEPENFAKWMQQVATVKGHGFTFVKHTARFNALRKFVYKPENVNLPEFKSLTAPVANAIQFLHPAVCVDPHIPMPEDLSFEARDCLTLARAIRKHAGDAFPSQLVPEEFFKDTPLLRMADVLPYEEALKTLCREWTALSASDPRHVALMKAVADARSALAELPDESVVDDALPAHVLHLAHSLQAQGLLPAIFFCFDRSGCEDICEAVLHQLEAAEALYKKNSRQYQAKLAAYAEWQRGSAERAREALKKAARKPDEDDAAGQQESSNSPWDSFDPDGILPELFSFWDERKVPKSELDELLDENRWAREKWQPWVEPALRRGIAVSLNTSNVPC
jgi:hypothetical protein